MVSQNLVVISGFVGQDPKITTFDNGNQIANISIATNHSYKNDKGEKIETTDWHPIVISGKRAKVVQDYVKKGTYIQIQGRLKHRSYTDKEGIDRYVTEVIADDMKFHNAKE